MNFLKKKLIRAKKRGRFLAPCPGTPAYLCCGYWIIENANGCPYDCSYCYLQTYLNQPNLIYYTNEKKLFRELAQFFKKNPGKFFRIGTGEFSDSLALDKFLGQAKKLILYFAQQKNGLLELKTKSAEVKHLLSLKHNGRTVIAWSVNPPEIVASEEKLTASLGARLASARLAAQAGYPVAFHFDPIIYFAGFEKSYQKLVAKIYEYVKPEQIAWISLGTWRFVPGFKEIFKKRFPNKKLIYEEFIPGIDGKMRYFKPLRIKIYRTVLKAIRKFDRKTLVYLCMESPSVWQKVLGSFFEKEIFRRSPYLKYFAFKKKPTRQPLQS